MKTRNWTQPHALRFVAMGSHSGGICACGWQTAVWHDTDRDVADAFKTHKEVK